jgi:chromosome segregation ATPase
LIIIRQLIEQANVAEGQDPNSEQAVCHLEIPQISKAQILGYMDDISMMFQLLGPKYLEVNQKLHQKEKDIFDAVKTKFNEDLKSYGEKMEGDKQNDLKKENENLKARLMAAESELNELSIQVDDKVKAAQTQGQNEISEKLLNETIEQYNKEIRDLQKRLTDTAGALSMSEKKYKELEAKLKESQAQSEKNFQDYQRIFQEYNNMVSHSEVIHPDLFLLNRVPQTRVKTRPTL